MADDDTAALLDVIGHGADILGVILPAVSVVGDVVKWFSQTPGASDPMMAALAKVDASLAAIEDELLQTWVIARQENLSYLAANSTAAMLTAFDFMRSGKDASSPEWAPKIALAQNSSLVAVQTFVSNLDGGYWLRPDSIKAISQDGDPTDHYYGWMDYIPDRPQKFALNTVWDYRWGLPATVYAITARLVVARLTGLSTAAIHEEVGQYNHFIASVYKRMDSGIKHFEAPGSESWNDILLQGIPIAVADIYGGYYIGGRFNCELTPLKLGNRPYPAGGMDPGNLATAAIFHNAKVITDCWRNSVAIRIGLPDLLWFAGQLENLLDPPAPAPSTLSLFHGGNGHLDEAQVSIFGVFYRVAFNGDLHWYKYEGFGESDRSGHTGWAENSGNPIGNGWGNFKFLLGAGNGVILSVEPNGDLRWHRYIGHGESNVGGDTGWAANSGNQIGRGWHSFDQLVVQPAVDATPMVIYGVLPNGNLIWHSYAGQGESDPTGSTGWVSNSGNPIGNGWQMLRLFCGGNVIFAVTPDGELRWYSYQGDGSADVSGATGWHPNSGNVIATNWSNYRDPISALSPGSFGQYIFAVDASRDLRWFYYTGNGAADPTGHTGWEKNYGNPIGNGW